VITPTLTPRYLHHFERIVLAHPLPRDVADGCALALGFGALAFAMPLAVLISSPESDSVTIRARAEGPTVPRGPRLTSSSSELDQLVAQHKWFLANVIAHPDCCVRGGSEIIGYALMFQPEGRLDRPLAALLAVACIGKFDQDCDELAAGKQKERVFVGAVRPDPYSISRRWRHHEILSQRL